MVLSRKLRLCLNACRVCVSAHVLKVFIEFQTCGDADRFGVWYSRLHPAPGYNIWRLNIPVSSYVPLRKHLLSNILSRILIAALFWDPLKQDRRVFVVFIRSSESLCEISARHGGSRHVPKGRRRSRRKLWPVLAHAKSLPLCVPHRFSLVQHSR